MKEMIFDALEAQKGSCNAHLREDVWKYDKILREGIDDTVLSDVFVDFLKKGEWIGGG
jgi:hypothetical protein